MENPAQSTPAPEPLPLRAALRKSRLAARESLPAAEHARLSGLVAEHLGAFMQGRAPGVLAFCWPYRSEFDARPLATVLLGRGWRACLPVVGDEVGPMRFREWTPATPMLADRHGIATPQAGAELHPNLLWLPFNAIDNAGYRLGYGAGYFDRTLAALRPAPYVVGVGFELAVAATVYPQAHDIPVDCFVTEAGIRTLRG